MPRNLDIDDLPPCPQPAWYELRRRRYTIKHTAILIGVDPKEFGQVLRSTKALTPEIVERLPKLLGMKAHHLFSLKARREQ